MAFFRARCILAQDLGASSCEGGMPSIHDALWTLEPVEEQTEPYAGLEQRDGVGAPGDSGGEFGGEFSADARLEHEVRDVGRKAPEHMLPHVAAQETRGALRLRVGSCSADHHQSDGDRPPLSLVEDRLGFEVGHAPVEQQSHLLSREAEGVDADEGLRVHQPMTGERQLEQGRPYQDDVQTLRRLLGEHAEKSPAPFLARALRIVDDQVHTLVRISQRPADLLVRPVRILQITVEIERTAGTLGAGEQRVHDPLSQPGRVGVERVESEPRDPIDTRGPIGDRGRLPESARGADHRQLRVHDGRPYRCAHPITTDRAGLGSRWPESHRGSRPRRAYGVRHGTKASGVPDTPQGHPPGDL